MTRLKHVLRQIRASYMQNVREGKCEHDPKALAYFDEQLERIDGHKKVSTKSKE